MKGLISDLRDLSKHLSSPHPITLNRVAWEEVAKVVNDLHRLVEIPQRGVDAAREEMTANEIKTKEEREVRTFTAGTYRMIPPFLNFALTLPHFARYRCSSLSTAPSS